MSIWSFFWICYVCSQFLIFVYVFLCLDFDLETIGDSLTILWYKCVIYFYLLANMLDIKKKIRYRSNEVRKTQNEHLIVFSKFVMSVANFWFFFCVCVCLYCYGFWSWNYGDSEIILGWVILQKKPFQFK